MRLTARPYALDPVLLAAVIALTVLGTVMVTSASISIADRQAGEPFMYLARHGLALAIAILVVFGPGAQRRAEPFVPGAWSDAPDMSTALVTQRGPSPRVGPDPR